MGSRSPLARTMFARYLPLALPILVSCNACSERPAAPRVSAPATPEPSAGVDELPSPTAATGPAREIVHPRNEEETGAGGQPHPAAHGESLANVLGVTVSGSERSYTFDVTIRSPDEGCAQYADYWEVLSQEGKLLYRRVLLHSHAGEQPFTRSGGAVEITATDEVIVRAHLHPAGYGGGALRGSVRGGFARTELEAGFAAHLAHEAPLPDGCAF